jgi:hypothetical protein
MRWNLSANHVDLRMAQRNAPGAWAAGAGGHGLHQSATPVPVPRRLFARVDFLYERIPQNWNIRANDAVEMAASDTSVDTFCTSCTSSTSTTSL